MDLKAKANQIRKEVVEICVKNHAGHIAPSLSCVDILVALYYQVMNLKFDKLVFSKAHGCYGLYAILADLRYIPRKWWENFYIDSPLAGCMERDVEHGVWAGCGALGHGLPMAVGMAWANKLKGNDYKTYCIVGDGEMDEGSNQEALNFAKENNLENLIVIIDGNGLKAMNEVPVKNEWIQWSWCDGHNMDDITTALKFSRHIYAKTIKGYGLKCMENVSKFHFRIPTKEEIALGNRYE